MAQHVQCKNVDSAKKGWFCTWPKCPVKKEDALVILETNGLPKIEEYVIAEEKHKDGESHLHAFLKFNKRVRFNQVKDKLDLLEYHGNYQGAKSWIAVKNYCKKDGDYISNINIEAADKHHSKKILYTDFERDALELLEEGKLNPMSLNNFLKNQATYLGLKKAREDDGKKKCYWIVGKPGIGKSFAIRSIFKDLYNKPQNKWWDGYKGEENVLLDDLDSATLGHYLKIWGDQYKFVAECKGYSINPSYKRFFVTSNYSIGELFHEEKLRDAVDRRFVTVNADEYIGENGFFDWDLFVDN